MKRTVLTRGVLIGLGVGTSVALLMTALDYLRNPAGIFRDESGVSWSAVAETWFSWFVPVLLLATVVAVLIVFWMSRSTAGR